MYCMPCKGLATSASYMPRSEYTHTRAFTCASRYMWQKGTLATVHTYPEVPLLDRAYNILGRDSGATLLCWYPCDVIRYVPPLLSVPVRHIGHLQTRTHRRHVSMMHMSHRPFRIRCGIRFHARTVSCHSEPYCHKQQLL